MEKTFDDYLKASPSERRKMNMSEILGEERLAKTKEQMSLEEAAKEYAEGPECTWVGTTALEYAFKAGAKWDREQILEYVKLAYGKVSMNPFDCSEAFEELLNKVGYETKRH